MDCEGSFQLGRSADRELGRLFGHVTTEPRRHRENLKLKKGWIK
jgi:hypothetical protein